MAFKASSCSALLRPFLLCFAMMVNLPWLMGSFPNFLRPTCSYTECRLRLLFVSDYSDLFFFRVLFFSVRFALIYSVGLASVAVASTSPLFSGSFPEPCPVSDPSATRQGSGIFFIPWDLMLPLLPVSPLVLYPSASSLDRMRFLSSVLCI